MELKRCWALLYALQVASSNLKAFGIERKDREVLGSDGKPENPRIVRNGNGSIDPNTLAGMLMKLLPANGSKEPLPAANIAEEFAMERKIPEQISPARGDKPRMERIGGVWAPPLP